MFLDLKPLLEAVPDAQCKLKHEDGALNFVPTKLARAEALAYQMQDKGAVFGLNLDKPAGQAGTRRITAAGVELPAPFLAGIKEQDGGVILVEGRAATDKPLVLSVEKPDGTVIAELQLELKISPVEQMFHYLNLRHLAPGGEIAEAKRGPQWGTSLLSPAPDDPFASIANRKNLVILHGYNVDAQKARGWQAEVFKRLHVLGSKARFVGVTWHGATGLDYHRAVFHAFQTGDALAGALGFTGSADLTVAAHSLGNMVVSHAIQSGGFAPARYYMINAATPLEAYTLGDVGAGQPANMTEQAWRILALVRDALLALLPEHYPEHSLPQIKELCHSRPATCLRLISST